MSIFSPPHKFELREFAGAPATTADRPIGPDRMPVLKPYLGDAVQTRKTHPCGSDQWTVERLGAEVGIRCQGCGRYGLMARARSAPPTQPFVSRPAIDPPTATR